MNNHDLFAQKDIADHLVEMWKTTGKTEHLQEAQERYQNISKGIVEQEEHSPMPPYMKTLATYATSQYDAIKAVLEQKEQREQVYH